MDFLVLWFVAVKNCKKLANERFLTTKEIKTKKSNDYHNKANYEVMSLAQSLVWYEETTKYM